MSKPVLSTTLSSEDILDRYSSSMPNEIIQSDSKLLNNSNDDDDATPRMLPKELKRLALENGGYETAYLNDKLYAHYKGYLRIEGLEPYTGLKAIWLDSNGFSKIEGLSTLTNLRCLYLQRNLIIKIEGLEALTSLVQLDLSENSITKLEGLAMLPNLSTLNVAKNALRNAASIDHLSECKAISVLDLSNNRITSDDLDGGEDFIKTLSSCKGIAALNMVGNPIVSEVPHFRKKIILGLKDLKFLDRPIFDMERATTEAWAVGGREAESKMKNEWKERERNAERHGMEDFRTWQNELLAKAEQERKEEAKNGPSEAKKAETERREKEKEERLAQAKKQAESEHNRYGLISTADTDHNDVTFTDPPAKDNKEDEDEPPPLAIKEPIKDDDSSIGESTPSKQSNEDSEDNNDNEVKFAVTTSNETEEVETSLNEITEDHKGETTFLSEIEATDDLTDNHRALIAESLEQIKRDDGTGKKSVVSFTDEMDAELSKLVVEHCFDFKLIGDALGLSADIVRERYCIIDERNQAKENLVKTPEGRETPPPSNLEKLVPEGGPDVEKARPKFIAKILKDANGDQPSYAAMQMHINNSLVKPGDLPSCDDGNDTDDEDVFFDAVSSPVKSP